MRRPSDYAHGFGERPPSHWHEPFYEGEPVDAGPAASAAPDTPAEPAESAEPKELATFRLLYESKRICLFETRDGHLTAVGTTRLV